MKRAIEFDIARFLRVRRAFGPSFSADGRSLAFLSNLTGRSEAFLVPLRASDDGYPPRDAGFPIQLTFDDRRAGLVAFAPDGDRLIVAADHDGDEHWQLTLIADRGELALPLTDDPAVIHHFGGWSPDGHCIAFAANARDPRHFDVHVMAIDRGDPRCVLETDGMVSVAGFSPDGARLFAVRTESTLDQDLLEIDLATGAARRLTPHTGRARHLQPAPSPDGRSLYLLTDRDSDVLTLARLDLATLDIHSVVRSDREIEAFSLSPDGRSIAYSQNVDGASEIRIHDLATSTETPILAPRGVTPSDSIDALRDTLVWSPDGAEIAFTVAAPRENSTIWLADTASGAARRLIAPPRAGLPDHALAVPEVVRFSSFDGLEIPALLYRPEGARPDGSHPAVVRFHGGPAGQSRPGFSAEVHWLVHRGYVVLAPNVRGSSGYGKRYLALDDIDLRMNSVADGRAAAEWLIREGWADPRRIAAMGASYGGFMVLASLATSPDLWAAGVDFFGQANWITFLENTHPTRRRHREAEYGSLDRDRALLERLSPIHHVDRIRAPLLAVHGERDMRVPIGETEQIVDALRARGVPVEFLRLADEGHGVTKLANQLRVYPAIAAFLDRHLRG